LPTLPGNSILNELLRYIHAKNRSLDIGLARGFFVPYLVFHFKMKLSEVLIFI